MSDAKLIKRAINESGITNSLQIAPTVAILDRPRHFFLQRLPGWFEIDPQLSVLPFADTILASLLSLPQISSVSLVVGSLDDDTVSMAASALRSNEDITHLELKDCRDRGRQMTVFCQNLPRNLVWLRVDFTRWHNISLSNQWQILNGISELPCLKSLLVKFSLLSDAPTGVFHKYLRTRTALEHVALEAYGDLSAVRRALQVHESIEHVDIRVDKKMDQEMGQVLGTFIRQNKRMKKFGLVDIFAREQATDEGISEVAKGLAASRNLCELELYMRPSSGQLQTLLTQGVQMARGITKLELGVDEAAGFTVLCAFLQTNTTLASLILHYQHDVCELFSSLETNQTLEELYITSILQINADITTALQRLTSLRVLGVPGVTSESDRLGVFEYTYNYDVMIPSLEMNLSLFEVQGSFLDIPEQPGKLGRIFRRNRLLASAQQGRYLPTRLWPVLFEWALRNSKVGPFFVFTYLHTNLEWTRELG